MSDFNYLGIVNRVLMQAKQVPITSMSTTVNTMAYRAQLAVNDALKDIAMILKIKTRLVEFEFSTVAGQRNYCIPKRIAYPFVDLRSGTTNNVIVNMPANDYDFFNSTTLGIADPSVYYLVGYQGVFYQRSSGSGTLLVSSSTADTSTVVIQGYDGSDNYASEEVSLTGVTAVATTNSYSKIDSISKGVTSGTVTVTDSFGAVSVLILAPKETHVRYPVIGLSSVPSAATTIYGRGYLTMPDLVNEYDMPTGLDDRALNAIISGAMYQFMRYDPAIKPEGLDFFKQNYYDEIRKIKSDNNDDGVQHFMKSPYFGIRHTGGIADPLDQGILG